MDACQEYLSTSETCHETVIWIIYLNVDDCLIKAIVHVSLKLRCSRMSWMLIMYFDLDPCCLFEVAFWLIIRYNLRYLKVIG